MPKKTKSKIIILLILYVILNTLFSYKNIKIYFTFIKPVIWLLFIIKITKKYSKVIQLQKKKESSKIYLIIIIYFLFQTINITLFGFTKGPYNYHFIAIFKNILSEIIPIIGIELLRFFLLLKNKQDTHFIILITSLLCIIQLDIPTLFFIKEKETLFFYICSVVISLITNNILSTFLVMNYSFTHSIVFNTIDKIKLFIFPIIPYTNWFITGSTNVLEVLLIYTLLKKNPYRQKRETTMLSYMTSFGISALLILFMLGTFPYESIAILSNSMNPTYERGDIVIYKKNFTVDEITPGSIIVYEKMGKKIIHRIVKMERNMYITKGDNNITSDLQKVKQEEIKGIYIFHIKYLGYPSIWLKEILQGG